MEGDVAAFDRADHQARLVPIDGHKVALHLLDQVVGQDPSRRPPAMKYMQPLAASALQREPAGPALVVKVAAPDALVLAPPFRRAVFRRLGQELVVPELQVQPDQAGPEGPQPFALGLLGDLGPDQGRRGPDDAESGLLLLLFGVTGPIVGQLFLLGDDPLAAAFSASRSPLGMASSTTSQPWRSTWSIWSGSGRGRARASAAIGAWPSEGPACSVPARRAIDFRGPDRHTAAFPPPGQPRAVRYYMTGDAKPPL